MTSGKSCTKNSSGDYWEAEKLDPMRKITRFLNHVISVAYFSLFVFFDPPSLVTGQLDATKGNCGGRLCLLLDAQHNAVPSCKCFDWKKSLPPGGTTDVCACLRK